MATTVSANSNNESSISDDLTSKLNLNNEVSSDSSPLSIDAKQKKKLDKLIDSIIRKSANGHQKEVPSIEDKYYLLGQKYFDQQEQYKKVQSTIKESEKTANNALKLREQTQAEYTKSLLAKTQLESLCRELQRHNKLIKEENMQRIKEEEEKRKEITTKFQSAIDEINSQVNANTDKNQTLIKENGDLAEKLKQLVGQYEVREEHVEKVLKHKDLENQLAEAKFQQSELKLNELMERSKKEKEIYENHCNELAKKCHLHEETEKQLRAQLKIYTQKYDEFQATLNKSNSVFESFRTEMDKMTKKMKKLEQETNTWKGKYEKAATTLKSIAENKDFLEKEIKKYQTKADVMEQLSRKLTTERTSLLQELKKAQSPETGSEEATTNGDHSEAAVVENGGDHQPNETGEDDAKKTEEESVAVVENKTDEEK